MKKKLFAFIVCWRSKQISYEKEKTFLTVNFISKYKTQFQTFNTGSPIILKPYEIFNFRRNWPFKKGFILWNQIVSRGSPEPYPLHCLSSFINSLHVPGMFRLNTACLCYRYAHCAISLTCYLARCITSIPVGSRPRELSPYYWPLPPFSAQLPPWWDVP